MIKKSVLLETFKKKPNQKKNLPNDDVVVDNNDGSILVLSRSVLKESVFVKVVLRGTDADHYKSALYSKQ